MQTHKRSVALRFCALTLLLLACVPVRAEPTVEPEADRVLRAACDYLAQANAFGVKVEVWRDATIVSGAVIQTTRTLDVQVRRPNRLRIEVASPRNSRGFWYENNTLTMLDRSTNFYGVMAVPGDIDGTIDAVEDEFGIEVPLGDVLVADPYANMLNSVDAGEYLGRVTVLSVRCHHLSFTGPHADCQLWIADGPKPLPRKITITLRKPEGPVQLTQVYSDWDLSSPISDSVFTFVPPASALKVVVNRHVADAAAAAPSEPPAGDNNK